MYRVIEALAAEGLDASRVDVLVSGGKLVVTPKKFLGDVWGEYNDFLRGAGFKWVSAGKLSHWEVG